jgi:hypothetical protein
VNRDGYRGGYTTAHHEAAHAVVGVLCGLVVGRVDIAPSRVDRRTAAGQTWMSRPATAWHIPERWFADSIASAAGFVWEWRWCGSDLRCAWYVSSSDRRAIGVGRFLIGIVGAWWLFRSPEVRRAIQSTAGELLVRKSGSIWGTTVEKICRRHGLLSSAVAS